MNTGLSCCRTDSSHRLSGGMPATAGERCCQCCSMKSAVSRPSCATASLGSGCPCSAWCIAGETPTVTAFAGLSCGHEAGSSCAAIVCPTAIAGEAAMRDASPGAWPATGKPIATLKAATGIPAAASKITSGRRHLRHSLCYPAVAHQSSTDKQKLRVMRRLRQPAAHVGQMAQRASHSARQFR